MESKVQISCKDITIAYERENVVENVSFDICEGDFLSIVGENGSGKSSLLKAILGLIPCKSGSITLSESIRKNHIGYLSQQNPMQKEFPASVFEVVLSGCLNSLGFWPFYRRCDKMRAHDNLRKLGMEELMNKSFADLSGGQKQRVLLARALCATDRILFLDEPVTGLDPVAIGELYQNIERLNKESITIVMVTHDIEKAVECSDKILHLASGGYFFGSADEYTGSAYRKSLQEGSGK